MKHFPLRLLLLLGVAQLTGGCASVEPQVERGRSLAGIKRYFVISNLNDNRALDRHIAATLRGRGFDADVGPLTMMPDDAQAVVTFQDHWGWDFGDHLAFLKITVSDSRTNQPFATATFNPRLPVRKPLPEIVGLLVDQIFNEPKR